MVEMNRRQFLDDMVHMGLGSFLVPISPFAQTSFQESAIVNYTGVIDGNYRVTTKKIRLGNKSVYHIYLEVINPEQDNFFHLKEAGIVIDTDGRILPNEISFFYNSSDNESWLPVEESRGSNHALVHAGFKAYSRYVPAVRIVGDMIEGLERFFAFVDSRREDKVRPTSMKRGHEVYVPIEAIMDTINPGWIGSNYIDGIRMIIPIEGETETNAFLKFAVGQKSSMPTASREYGLEFLPNMQPIVTSQVRGALMARGLEPENQLSTESSTLEFIINNNMHHTFNFSEGRLSSIGSGESYPESDDVIFYQDRRGIFVESLDSETRRSRSGFKPLRPYSIEAGLLLSADRLPIRPEILLGRVPTIYAVAPTSNRRGIGFFEVTGYNQKTGKLSLVYGYRPLDDLPKRADLPESVFEFLEEMYKTRAMRMQSISERDVREIQSRALGVLKALYSLDRGLLQLAHPESEIDESIFSDSLSDEEREFFGWYEGRVRFIGAPRIVETIAAKIPKISGDKFGDVYLHYIDAKLNQIWMVTLKEHGGELLLYNIGQATIQKY